MRSTQVSWRMILGWFAGALAVAAAVYVVFWPLTDLIARHDVGTISGADRAALQAARDAARGRLIGFGAGLFAAGALVYTARNFSLSRAGQVTDRYTKAIGQLGETDKLDVRMGGVYALERIARDSRRDHPTIMEVLAAFIRDHSREQWPPAEPDTVPPERTTRPDIQAAATVIGRRTVRYDDGKRINLDAANLTKVDLTGADLTRVSLKGATLIGADLRSVTRARARPDSTDEDLDRPDFTGADLTGAKLGLAHLTHANFDGAILADAKLGFAHLARANFHGAQLRCAEFVAAQLLGAFLDKADLSRAFLDADLTGADLTEANLTGADLTGANPTSANFTGAKLAGAGWPVFTKVPEGWYRDPSSGRLDWIGTGSGGATTD